MKTVIPVGALGTRLKASVTDKPKSQGHEGIDKMYVYFSLIPLKDKNEVEVNCLDYNTTVKHENEEDLEYNGQVDLVKSVLKKMKVMGKGIRIYLHRVDVGKRKALIGFSA